MNNNKKIINTLRNADKDSVEKLMAEETKKNEIFAKIQRKANIEKSKYADNVSGVEKYDRRISMIRIASIAASAILITGSVGGGAAYIMNNKKPVKPVPNPMQSSTATTTEAETPSVTEAATEAMTTGVVETATKTTDVVETATKATSITDTATKTTSISEAITPSAETDASNEDEKHYSVTKEDIIQKADSFYCVNYFDKFSADYTVIINERREFHTEPETLIGKIYLDETDLTASATVERYANDKRLSKSLIAIMDNYYYNAEESWVETDFVNGGYKFLETPDKYYYVKDQNTNKVFITPRGRAMNIDVNAPENWDITGERTENGRKIISISGVQKGDNNYEGVYREIPYFMEVDAETGMMLSYDEYDSEGNMTSSYKMTNYKFDDDAVEFRTASDIISEIENGGFRKM